MNKETFTCTLAECPPGFFRFGDSINFKSEYGDSDAYCGSSGEYFWGGTSDRNERARLIVEPLPNFPDELIEAETDEQHKKSYAMGYKDGWRDGRLPLNNPQQSEVGHE